MVAAPLMAVVPTPTRVLVVAPPLTLLVMRVIALNWDGRLSTNVPLVRVLGPALLITTVKVFVAPEAMVLLAWTFEIVSVTLGATLRVALAVFELVPTVVVRDPAGMVLVTVPPAALVTTVVIEHTPFAGITVLIGNVRVAPPAFADGVTPEQLEPSVGPKFTRPAG